MFSYKVDDEIKLALPRLSDVDELYALIDADRDDLGRFLPWVDHVQSIDDELPTIQNDLNGFAAGTSLNLFIWYHGRLAGNISLNKIRKRNLEADVGYFLGKSFRGHGIMTRAVQALLDIAFEEYGLHRVYLECAADNLPSNGVAQRCGMRLEGTFHGRLILKDGYHDCNHYAVLAEEWPDIKASLQ